MKSKSLRWLFAIILSCLICTFLTISYAGTFELPASLITIEPEAFEGDTSIDRVVLPQTITRIESKAFAHSTLKRINLPESLTYIAPDAFDGCNPLVCTGSANTYASRYCKENGITFVPYDEPVTYVQFTEYPTEVYVGDQFILDAYAYPENASLRDISLHYDTEYITASGNGYFTANKSGTVTITATAMDGSNCSTKINIKIYDKLVISAYATTKTIITNETKPSGYAHISGGKPPYTISYTWHADGYELAQQSHMITDIVDASTYWECDTCSNDSGKFHVDIICIDSFKGRAVYTINGFEMKLPTIAVTGITLDKTNINLNVGESATLTATITPGNATNKSISWKSSNTSVATVDSTGKVTAVAAGSATITASANDNSGTKAAIAVIVNKPGSLTISATADTKQIYQCVTKPSGTLTIAGGVAPYNIRYSWYCDGASGPQQVYEIQYSTEGTVGWQFDTCNTPNSYYVEFHCQDAIGTVTTYQLTGFNVYNDLKSGIQPDTIELEAGAKFTVDEYILIQPTGGTAPYKIYVGIHQNNTAFDYISYTLTPPETGVLFRPQVTLTVGTYNVVYNIEDANGAWINGIARQIVVTEPSSISATVNGSGNSRTISISANGSWTAESNETWITLSKTSGSRGTSTITATLATNPSSTTSRSGSVTFSCGTKTASVTITQAPANSVSISPASHIGRTPDGGVVSPTITANSAWTAVSDSSWLTLSQTSGSSGSTKVNMTYAKNTSAASRTATVTITCGTKTATYKLTQNAYHITARASGSSNTRTIHVFANNSWTAKANAAWITLSKTADSGNGSTSITATLAANPSTTSSRSGTVTFTCGVMSTNVTITQAPASDVSISPTTSTGGNPDGGGVSLTITANDTWTAVSDSSWLTLEQTSGSSGSTQVDMIYAMNNSSSSRTATVTIVCGTAKATYKLTQNAHSITASVNGSGSSRTISVSANGSWTAKSNVAWITLNKVSGNRGSSSVTATLAANPSSTSSRSGTITFTCGTKTTSVTITQEAATVFVTGVSLNTGTKELTPNETTTLTATVLPSNATNKSVTWKSSNTTVATVDSTGKVTAKAAGSATITVTTADGSKTATCAVTVKVPPTGVSLNKTSATLSVGATTTLTATVAPSNATNKSVSWKSSNTTVATVDSTGKVTAKAAGSATITVTTTDGSKTATCAVTVYSKPTVSSITTPKTSYSVNDVVPYTINISGGKAPYTVKVVEYFKGAKKYEYTFNSSATGYAYNADSYTSGGTNYIVATVTDSLSASSSKQSGNVQIYPIITLGPTATCSVSGTTATFNWPAVTGATSYDIEIYTATNWNLMLQENGAVHRYSIKKTVTGTSYSTTLANGNYVAYVAAGNPVSWAFCKTENATKFTIGNIIQSADIIAKLDSQYRPQSPKTYFTDSGIECTHHGSVCSYNNESSCNCKCYYNGRWLGSIQCLAYARYVQYKTYGYDEFNNPGKFIRIATDCPSAYSYSATTLQNWIKTAGVGAHIRTNSHNVGYQHSLIVTDITSTGFTIIDANSDGKCGIAQRTYTWQSFVDAYAKRGMEDITYFGN